MPCGGHTLTHTHSRLSLSADHISLGSVAVRRTCVSVAFFRTLSECICFVHVAWIKDLLLIELSDIWNHSFDVLVSLRSGFLNGTSCLLGLFDSLSAVWARCFFFFCCRTLKTEWGPCSDEESLKVFRWNTLFKSNNYLLNYQCPLPLTPGHKHIIEKVLGGLKKKTWR